MAPWMKIGRGAVMVLWVVVDGAGGSNACEHGRRVASPGC